MKTVLNVLISIGLCTGLWGAQDSRSPEVQLKAAMHKEEVQGDLKGAIEAYRKLAQGSNRAVAAKALIRMGQCYEKLGDAEAAKAYERVVREFADQKEAVEQARALLAAGGRSKPNDTGIIDQQKWVLPVGRTTCLRRISPDGRYIPFLIAGSRNMSTGSPDLWLHDLTTGEDRKVVEGQAGVHIGCPELSPDSKQIAYQWDPFKGAAELRIADIDGSHARVLLKDDNRTLGAWSPDGKHLLIYGQGAVTAPDVPLRLRTQLALVSMADGSIRELAQDVSFNGNFSPDGKYYATYPGPTGYENPMPWGGLKLVQVDSRKVIPLFEEKARDWAPFWAPDGRRILFLSDRSGRKDLWSIRVSDGRPEGEPELVRRDAGAMIPLGFTRDGLFYYQTRKSDSDIYQADLDPATGRVISKPKRVNQRFVGSVQWPVEWSPDGKFLAYRREPSVSSGTRASIIVRSEVTGEEREIHLLPATAFNLPNAPGRLKWFPDGRYLLATDRINNVQVARKIDIETGQVSVFLDLSAGGQGVYAPVLSPDGRALFYITHGQGAETSRLMRRDLATGAEKEVYQAPRQVDGLQVASLGELSLSADGRQLALIQDYREGSSTLIIVPAEGGTHRELLRCKPGIYNAIHWAPDNKRVLMVRMFESGPYQLWAAPLDGGEAQPCGLAMEGLTAFSVHPDGRRIAFYGQQESHEEIWAIKNLLSTLKPLR